MSTRAVSSAVPTPAGKESVVVMAAGVLAVVMAAVEMAGHRSFAFRCSALPPGAAPHAKEI
jgi:hypothetical protein